MHYSSSWRLTHVLTVPVFPTSGGLLWISWPPSLVFWPTYPAMSAMRRFAWSAISGTDPEDCRKLFKIHDNEVKPVNPKAPEVKKPVIASPIAIAAGTITGLNIINRGVVTRSPIKEPARVKPASASKVPATGRSVTTATT